MINTLHVMNLPGGGVWGIAQLAMLSYAEEVTGLAAADMADAFVSSSIGTVPGTVLLIPDPDAPDRPLFSAEALIDPVMHCAADLFGPDTIDAHYVNGVRHDLLRHLNPGRGRIKSMISSLFHSRKEPLHKPHHVLGDFLEACIGDVTQDDLLRSSIILAHHYEEGRRVAFVSLKPDLFDSARWDGGFLPNHAVNLPVREAIMASTAAPTVFKPYNIGDAHYIDFDASFGPLFPVQQLRRCLYDCSSITVKVTEIACGRPVSVEYDPAVFAENGPLGQMQPLFNAMARDSKGAEWGALEQLIGPDNIVRLVPDTSSLSARETETAPAACAFNGNRSNLVKIAEHGHLEAKKHREAFLRHADAITEERARRAVVEPAAGFSWRGLGKAVAGIFPPQNRGRPALS